MAATMFRLERCRKSKSRVRQFKFNRLAQKLRQGERFCADPIQTGFFYRAERPFQRRHAQHRRSSYLQSGCAESRRELVQHIQHLFFAAAPPSRQAGLDGTVTSKMPAIKIKPADGAGSCIDIFMMSPKREIGVPFVERMREHSDRMREIQTDDDPVRSRCPAKPGRIEQLPARM